MATLSALTLEVLHDVLAQFAIGECDIHDIRAGRVNKHWRVSAGANQYALRRYNHHRPPEAIRYEHKVLQHMKRKAWPVAVPLRTVNGRTLAELRGYHYSLFPFLAGRPGPAHSLRYLRIRGGLLARLHRDLASWPAPGQRPGFGRIWDLDVYMPALDGRTFDSILNAFGHEQPEIADSIRAQRAFSLKELASLGYESLPDTAIHADFHRDNVLFHRRRLTAVLDFDLVRMDARVADIAMSIALDCPQPPAYASIDPDAVSAFVAGYCDESPLSETEMRLGVPLVRAYFLWLCAFNLSRWAEGDVDKATRSLARSASQRLPNLEARGDAIQGALSAAAKA